MNTEDLRAISLMTAAGLEQVASILDTSSAALPSSWAIAKTWADELRDRAAKRTSKRFTIMIMGEFKRGKSTLLNALLGAEVLPQKITPCTAIITRIIYGPEPKVRVVFGDGRPDDFMSLEDFESRYSLEIEDTVQGGFGDEDEAEAFYEREVRDRFGHIEEAIIEYPSDLCRDGVELVDTPGLSEHDDREQRTLTALKNADAVLMTLSAMQQLNKRERRVIDQRLLPFRSERKLFFPINHWNLLLQTVVDPTNDEKVRKTFREQEKMIDLHVRPLVGDLANDRIFRINALGALQYRIRRDAGQLEATGVPSLEAAIKRFLSEERPRAEKSSDALLLKTTRNSVAGKIQMDIRGLATPLETLEAEYQAIEPRLNALRAHGRHIDHLIQAKSGELEREICSSLDAHIKKEIEDKVEADAQDFDLGKAGSLLGRLGGVFDGWRKHEDKTSTHINDHITRTLKDYINPRIQAWKESGARPVIQVGMEKLSEALQQEMKDYGKEVDEITRGSGGQDAIDGIIKKAFNQLIPRGGQVMSDLGSDLSPLLVSVVFELIAHSVFAFAALDAFVPGLGLLISAALMCYRAHRIKEETRNTVIHTIRDGMPKLRLSLQEALRKQIDEAFKLVTVSISSAIAQQIHVLEASAKDMIELKKQGQFNADKQKAKLDEFARIFNEAVDALMAKLTA